MLKYYLHNQKKEFGQRLSLTCLCVTNVAAVTCNAPMLQVYSRAAYFAVTQWFINYVALTEQG